MNSKRVKMRQKQLAIDMEQERNKGFKRDRMSIKLKFYAMCAKKKIG